MERSRVKQPLFTRGWGFWVLWALLAVAGVGVAVYSAIPYLGFNPALTRIPLNDALPWHYLSIAVHGLPGTVVLLIGPFQFVPAIRNRYPALHRVLGRAYLLGVLVGGIVAILAALASTSGLAAQTGFLLLAAGWLYTGFMAYRTARQRQFALHRVWMIRNYALSFAAVLLRVGIVLGQLYTARYPDGPITFEQTYTTSVWSSVLISYLVAEWFIVQRTLEPIARRSEAAMTPASSSKV